jgi:hypothetical protein
VFHKWWSFLEKEMTKDIWTSRCTGLWKLNWLCIFIFILYCFALFEIGFHCVDQANFKLTVFLPWSPKHSDYKLVPPYLCHRVVLSSRIKLSSINHNIVFCSFGEQEWLIIYMDRHINWLQFRRWGAIHADGRDNSCLTILESSLTF